MKPRSFLPLILSIALCELSGIFGAFFTIQSIPTWYAALHKPSLSPPSWLFGPVWVTLYALMGVAAYLIWRGSAGSPVSVSTSSPVKRKRALIAFGIQLALNAIWTPLFFGLHNPLAGLVDIVALLIAIVVTIKLFYKISKPAAWLLVPYLAWVGFATYLNYSIWKLN